MPISPFLSQDRIDEMTNAGFWGSTTLIDHFDEHVQNTPDKIAVVDYSSETNGIRSLTYSELDRYVTRYSVGLIKLGVDAGDVISCQLANRWEFLALYLASVRIGAAMNPLMPIFRHRELTYMLGFSEAKVVVVAKTFRGFDHEQMMLEIQPDLPSLEHVLAIGGEDSPGSFEEKLATPKWEEEAGIDAMFAERKLGPNSVTQLLFTSGTTGDPKGVMQISNTILACTRNFVEGYDLTDADNILMSSPLAHQTGFLVGIAVPIFLGSKMVYQDVWDADKAIQIVHDEKIHFTMASTPFLSDMTNSPLLDTVNTDQFRIFVTAGAPVPRVVAEEARNRMHCQVYSAYGMTENFAVTLCKPGDSIEKVYATDGVAQKGVQVRIVDAEGNVVPTGEEGQVETLGSYNFCGYLKREDLTKQAVNAEGWLNTGDLARMDEDGFIRITGRSKDILIRGGENVPVVEVENLIYKHPAVLDAALVGVPDLRLGERGCLFVTLKDDAEFSMKEMIRYLEENKMAKQYWPEFLELPEDLPRTLSGKIQKFKLRDMALKHAAN